VDHASKDGSAAMLRRWKTQDSRLRIVNFDGPSLPGALNAGLAECRGRFVARMDADDLCLPRRLEAQAAYLGSHADCGLCATQVEYFGKGELSEGYASYAAWVNSLLEHESLVRERFIECPMPHPAWMAPRQVFETLGGYEDDGFPEDYSFVLRAVEAGFKLAKLPEVLLRWREHAQRHSRLHPRYGRQAFFGLKARHLARMLGGRPCVLWGAGDRGRLLTRFLLEQGAKVEFLVGLGEGTSAHGLPVLKSEEVPDPLPGPLIACVGAPGAREMIRSWCSGRKLTEAGDYWFAS
jgi:glycosyltransferase involved in cell wall biosynthesis